MDSRDTVVEICSDSSDVVSNSTVAFCVISSSNTVTVDVSGTTISGVVTSVVAGPIVLIVSVVISSCPTMRIECYYVYLICNGTCYSIIRIYIALNSS